VRRLFDFLFKKGSITVVELQMFNIILNLILCPLKILPMKHFVDTHPTIIVALDLSLVTVLALFGMIALLGARKEITLKDVINCLLYNFGKETKEEFLRYRADTLLDQADLETRRYIRSRLDEHEQDLQPKADTVDENESPTISERLFATAAASWGSDSMQAEFDRLMTEEKLFLNPKLRLDDIAERLHTNKTYVSRMVNQSYEMGFSELINIMRIDFAEQYITKNSKAKQAEIAEACGFISASAFNSIFKKVTGMTPKAWIAQWNSANETL
jgi:AraC-like DNA-binding protein